MCILRAPFGVSCKKCGLENSKLQTLTQMLAPLFLSARAFPSLITNSSLNPNQNPSNAAKTPQFDKFRENRGHSDAAIKVPTAPWMKGPLLLRPDEILDAEKRNKPRKSEEKTFKALNRRESGVRGRKAMKKIVRNVEKLDEDSDSQDTQMGDLSEFDCLARIAEETTESSEKRFGGRMPWEREEERFILRRTKKERVPTTAELILDEGLLNKLRREASKMRKWVNVRKAGVTEPVVNEIRSIWRSNELAMVRFDIPLCRNMERAQEIIEMKTGGLVVLSKKEFVVVYRGGPSNSTEKTESGQDEISSSLYEREADRLLDGLGPRYMDWWMRRPFPVDADLLPEVVNGYRTPSRRCPPNTRAKLSDEELTYLRNIAQALPFHFVLGRNHGLQGLASAIVKLWERSTIAKIAIKWGAINTNNEKMADELKHLTGGVLILRNRYLIILFRGKDFLSDENADLVIDRERLLSRYQHFEETKRESQIEIVEVVTNGKQLEETSKTGTLLEFQELQRKFGEMETRNLETEAEKARLEKELKSQEHKLSILKLKIEKSTKELFRLNSLWKPSERDDDIEILTKEERECLRRVGLKMNSSLVLGRRGVFYGVMEGLHQHWKHREVAKVITMQKIFSRVLYSAKSLEAESNGVLISIEKLKEGHAILIYRGKNYKRPSSKLMAQNLLTKRKALQRSVAMQRLGSLKFFAYQRERAIEDLKVSLVNLEDSASELG
ncbi:chloroplastic group IIA intron splicing facilitator CRS1, chloroplastic [Capsella rubella]|uniref:chloroplastic group IIA intron splicing facilitator CRS1, chloroplastic n=1 Tax=Capsella rubella TaxID=81985 RepID=UPI000CD561D1|nr:chloroplastic group IIA intron splicing facilitator CRS1, chloroplastic [Capsella rubella]